MINFRSASTDAKWEQILSLNLTSNFRIIKAVLPGMKRRNRGRIVNIASAHGLVASPFKSAYVAAKHGVLALTKAVALEVAESSITCNAVCPGYVKTSLVEGQITDQAKVHGMSEKQVIRDVILASQPNKRFVELDQLAAFVVFSLLGGGILDHRHSVANRRRLDSSLSGAGRLWWQSHYHSQA